MLNQTQNSTRNSTQNSAVRREEVSPMTSRGGEIRVMLTPKTVEAKRLIMGYAHLKPGETIINHVHDYGEEAIYVISGTGLLILDGDQNIGLEPNLAAIVHQGQTHEITNTGPELLEMVFASAPLAPTPSQGHRELPKQESGTLAKQESGT
ncbi:MAG: cupin domain-containing protein [bacterium]